MSDVERKEIAVIDAPYRRQIRLEEARFESGMTMFRMIVREGHRITQVDLDGEAAALLAGHLGRWAAGQGKPGAGA